MMVFDTALLLCVLNDFEEIEAFMGRLKTKIN